ncbi:MAG: bifunctional hydroxymethylpyrimidine kinase/phosphomethylpyrimidine kinase [Candidatus Eremiobacteraeota bacterium]|nr:bifunctional hydroxymethylpyrimidine kinase/phosphomethylpyrimidine kinase [Candidatus Eremiobacteraeota bacterium]
MTASMNSSRQPDGEMGRGYPLIGSIQNSVGMGFLGNQCVFAVANALGARAVAAPSQFASAHGGFSGRSNTISDPGQFRRDVAFAIAQRPAVLVVGYLPKPVHVEIVSELLEGYTGVVLLDPVIGDHEKGLYVSAETARAIKEHLVPMAQMITPNRFEAEVLLGIDPSRTPSEHEMLNGLIDLGPHTVVVTSFQRDVEKKRLMSLFSNGYSYYRITSPFYTGYPAHGVGDTFTAGIAAFIAIGASPFSACVLATTLCARAVLGTTTYGGATVDPVGALQEWRPLGYHIDDDKAMKFCAKSLVMTEQIKATAYDGPRLKFAPPTNKIRY